MPTYPSEVIWLQDWMVLFTLCFAPVIVHIISGVPQPTYLSHNRPPWHEYLCHYNPTSIVWRYAAITDRRIRAKSWSLADMAAANALFYSDEGRWDGSEEMAARSALYCVALPRSSWVALFSWSSVKTIIVALQGVQAVSAIVRTEITQQTAYYHMGLDVIFLPVAVFGLLRLYAALWLTESYIYLEGSEALLRFLSDPFLDLPPSRCSLGNSMSVRLLNLHPRPATHAFHHSSYWWSRLFRIFFLTNILAFWVSAVLAIPLLHQQHGTMTCISVVIVGIVFLGSTTAIYAYYFSRGCKSTIIPCISSLWYKLYSIALGMALAALVVIAALETRKTPCGVYTSGSRNTDSLLCPGLVYIGADFNSSLFGMAGYINQSDSALPAVSGQFVVVNFTGVCQGVSGSTSAAVFKNYSEIQLR